MIVLLPAPNGTLTSARTGIDLPARPMSAGRGDRPPFLPEATRLGDSTIGRFAAGGPTEAMA